MSFLKDLEKLQAEIKGRNQSELARSTHMKQQTLNRLANTGLESVTARNLDKLVDELGYKLVDGKSCPRGQADIEREILQRVFEACAAAPIDDTSRMRIIAAVTGKSVAEQPNQIQRAVGN